MENAEEIFNFLEDFSKRKPKTIPQELNEYLAYVARTGDPVYQWSLVKCLFKEKLLNVITDFYETSPGVDIPPYPNVDPFNYDTLKNSLLERLDSFTSAPFTVQRICELLAYPRKQYNRVDKYMRAIEKNILVVSTREPGIHRHAEAENGEPIVNGSDNNSEYNVDVEMEDMSWKETKEQPQNPEPQPSSSESYSIAEIEARLRAKQGFPTVSEDKPTESFTPTQHSDQSSNKVEESESKQTNFSAEALPSTSINDTPNVENVNTPEKTNTMEVEVKPDEPVNQPMIIPEIKINDASIGETIAIETNKDEKMKDDKIAEKDISEDKCMDEKPQPVESNIPSESKESEPKVISEVSEVSSSSEESSSSSDNTDGNSNSPKAITDDQMDEKEPVKLDTDKPQPTVEPISEVVEKTSPAVMQSDNYSITDVNSELPQISASNSNDSDTQESVESVESVEDKTEAVSSAEVKDSEELKTETETETEKKIEASNESGTPV